MNEQERVLLQNERKINNIFIECRELMNDMIIHEHTIIMNEGTSSDIDFIQFNESIDGIKEVFKDIFRSIYASLVLISTLNDKMGNKAIDKLYKLEDETPLHGSELNYVRNAYEDISKSFEFHIKDIEGTIKTKKLRGEKNNKNYEFYIKTLSKIHVQFDSYFSNITTDSPMTKNTALHSINELSSDIRNIVAEIEGWVNELQNEIALIDRKKEKNNKPMYIKTINEKSLREELILVSSIQFYIKNLIKNLYSLVNEL